MSSASVAPSASGAGGAPAEEGGMGGAGGVAAGPVDVAVPSYEEVVDIVDRSCARGVCHIPEEYGGIDPNMTNLEGELFGNLTSRMVTQCGEMALVTPGDPENSAIVQLPQHNCGEFVMPDGCLDNPCIPQTDIAALTAWISAGAEQQ